MVIKLCIFSRSFIFLFMVISISMTGCGSEEAACEHSGNWGICSWDYCEEEDGQEAQEAWFILNPGDIKFECESSWDCKDAYSEMWNYIEGHCNPNVPPPP